MKKLALLLLLCGCAGPELRGPEKLLFNRDTNGVVSLKPAVETVLDAAPAAGPWGAAVGAVSGIALGYWLARKNRKP